MSKIRINVTGRDNQLLLNVPKYNLAEIWKAERMNLHWKSKITTNETVPEEWIYNERAQ